MLEINAKQDILIPFEKIGDARWEENTQTILEALANNWGGAFERKPILEEEITELEKRLGTTLPQSLKIFYQTFGVVDIGEELIAIDEIDFVQKFWSIPEYAPDFSAEEKEIIPNLVWFGDYLGNGNMFCFHKETKEIYYFDHDTKPYITKLFNDFGDYLKGCLILAQAELSSKGKHKKVEQWTEEITTEIFTEEVIEKWRY